LLLPFRAAWHCTNDGFATYFGRWKNKDALTNLHLKKNLTRNRGSFIPDSPKSAKLILASYIWGKKLLNTRKLAGVGGRHGICCPGKTGQWCAAQFGDPQ
jgi:hypothetical protein